MQPGFPLRKLQMSLKMCIRDSGKPVTALNILAFPSCMGTEVVGDVLRGGADKVREAGAFVVGGHSIEDDEPKYGLSVFGLVHPERMVRNGGAQPGDAPVSYTHLDVYKRQGTGDAG